MFVIANSVSTSIESFGIRFVSVVGPFQSKEGAEQLLEARGYHREKDIKLFDGYEFTTWEGLPDFWIKEASQEQGHQVAKICELVKDFDTSGK